MKTSTLLKSRTGITLGILSLVALSMAGLCHVLVRPPEFYADWEQISGPSRVEQSKQFIRRSADVWNQIENDQVWSGVFQDDEVNAWLAHDFVRNHSGVLPEGISEPRVAFDQGQVALAFKVTRGPLVTVLSLRGRMWLPEPNLLAMELDDVRAGLVPLPAGAVVQLCGSAARSCGMEVEWKQHAGKLVALIRLNPSRQQGAISLEELALRDGSLYLVGRSSANNDSSRPLSPPEGHIPSGMSWNVQPPEESVSR